ncbi:isoleucyl-tRNA synthetase [Campylobacter sp. faydin G-105]|uniref:isoleucyl-tRNA synthetase n=1 Tax=Campylobacter anatolicus TaxID=2829105 RepID=UPI001B904B07|nr:isoleucyl-tRNA synthetase [Campylobacter anatolicus]MBR8461736.1 isoleucyl-tRNA synthetase [Campylobacter anatolicus]
MKFVNSFFAGIIFTLAPIFTLFVGLKNNYFDHYGVNEYFNTIFVDNVPFLWLLPIFLAVGYTMFYAPFRRIFRAFYTTFLLLCLFSWYPKFGLILGDIIFMSEPYERTIAQIDGNIIGINGRDVYIGRDKIYFLSSQNDKVLKIKR